MTANVPYKVGPLPIGCEVYPHLALLFKSARFLTL